MGMFEITQTHSVAIHEEDCDKVFAGLGARSKAKELLSWLSLIKKQIKPILSKQEAEVWCKISISAPKRGSNTCFDTEWLFHCSANWACC